MQNYTFYHQTRRLTLFIMICIDVFTTGPSCSKHRLFNKLVKRLTRYQLYASIYAKLHILSPNAKDDTVHNDLYRHFYHWAQLFKASFV